MDPVARHEYESHQVHNADNETLQTFRDQFSHPYDWYCFRQLIAKVKLCLLHCPEVRRLVLVGSGTGFEAAMLWRELPTIQEVIILDLGFRMVQLSRPTFAHLGVSMEHALPLVADFNYLPFHAFDNDTIGLAFRCLHHAADIERPLAELQRVFQHIIIVEPIWTLPIRFLSSIGFANRPEHVEEHRPQRLTLAQLGRQGWEIKKTFILEIPRDRLPGLQRRQGSFRQEDLSSLETFMSKGYSALVRGLDKIASFLHVGNYTMVQMVRTNTGSEPKSASHIMVGNT